MSVSFRLVAFALASLVLAGAADDASAQWKWKDKAGRVQYSDLPPPPETPEADILSRPGGRARTAQVISTSPLPAASMAAATPAAPASGASAPKLTDPALEAARKKAEAEAAAKTKADEARVAAARADNCQRAKSQLATIDSGTRLVRANEKGEREYLDDRQRAEEAKRARDLISSDCR